MTLRTWRWTIALAVASLAAGCYDLEMPDRVEADCLDPNADVCWQRLSSGETTSWLDAIDYCDKMGLGGFDWRLPSIGELRSLIAGCGTTEIGGACGVTDDCLDSTDCAGDACIGCTAGIGPGSGDNYWVAELEGPSGCYWSSSSWTNNSMNAWGVSFESGAVGGNAKGGYCFVRCVADAEE